MGARPHSEVLRCPEHVQKESILLLAGVFSKGKKYSPFSRLTLKFTQQAMAGRGAGRHYRMHSDYAHH